MKLLLAEDERSLSRAIIHILQKNNYTADAVYDGLSALDYLAAGDYDGVILDIMMPKLDGISVLRTLRAQGNPVPGAAFGSFLRTAFPGSDSKPDFLFPSLFPGGTVNEKDRFFDARTSADRVSGSMRRFSFPCRRNTCDHRPGRL